MITTSSETHGQSIGSEERARPKEHRRNRSPIGHNNTKHYLCPIRSRHPVEFLDSSSVTVGTQGFFRPHLKTFLAPFLPT